MDSDDKEFVDLVSSDESSGEDFQPSNRPFRQPATNPPPSTNAEEVSMISEDENSPPKVPPMDFNFTSIKRKVPPCFSNWGEDSATNALNVNKRPKTVVLLPPNGSTSTAGNNVTANSGASTSQATANGSQKKRFIGIATSQPPVDFMTSSDDSSFDEISNPVSMIEVNNDEEMRAKQEELEAAYLKKKATLVPKKLEPLPELATDEESFMETDFKDTLEVVPHTVHDMMISGVKIKFPVKPYPCQISVMNHVSLNFFQYN